MASPAGVHSRYQPRFFNLRLLNYSFYLFLIVVFVVIAGPLDKVFILLALLASILASYAAFVLRLLSLDGMRTAVIVGTISLGVGGLEYAVYLLFFFFSSNLLGLLVSGDDGIHPASSGLVERRTAEQVWSNSFWFVLFLMLFYTTGYWSFAAASAAAVAVATSDTWATITGSSSTLQNVRLISTGERVAKGTDGGITLRGVVGGVAGALAIAILVWWFHSAYAVPMALIVAASGFSGCLIDSYFGARFQYASGSFTFFGYTIRPGNHLVNFMATGAGALIAMILYNIYFYALV